MNYSGVGNVAVQYAKHVLNVRRVIGIAGSPAKCKWLRSIGADVALCYKSLSFADELADAGQVGGGIDCFFDNVGGEILDMVLPLMKPHGRISAVGAMAGTLFIPFPPSCI